MQDVDEYGESGEGLPIFRLDCREKMYISCLYLH